MKPIRDYNDGQWLLLLWGFILVFLITGLAMSRPVLVVAIIGAVGATYTTYLYARERIGRSPTGSLLGRRTGGTTVIDTVEPAPRDANPEAAPRETENHEGGAL